METIVEQLFGIAADTSITMKETVVCMLFSVMLGLIISGVYLAVTKKEGRSGGFFLSLVMLPAVVTVVIILIGSNVARAFSIAGVFQLVRFRSAPGESKDISLVFMAMAAGLAAGLGYLTLSLAITVVLAIVILLIHQLGSKLLHTEYRQLRLLVPEDMDYVGAFDDLMEEYAAKSELFKIKTTDMGTLYELTYRIVLKAKGKEKEFMDAIRCRNGNLTVMLSALEPKIKEEQF